MGRRSPNWLWEPKIGLIGEPDPADCPRSRIALSVPKCPHRMLNRPHHKQGGVPLIAIVAPLPSINSHSGRDKHANGNPQIFSAPNLDESGCGNDTTTSYLAPHDPGAPRNDNVITPPPLVHHPSPWTVRQVGELIHQGRRISFRYGIHQLRYVQHGGEGRGHWSLIKRRPSFSSCPCAPVSHQSPMASMERGSSITRIFDNDLADIFHVNTGAVLCASNVRTGMCVSCHFRRAGPGPWVQEAV